MKRSIALRAAVAAAAKVIGRHAVDFAWERLALDVEMMRYPGGRCVTSATLDAAVSATLTISRELADRCAAEIESSIDRGDSRRAAALTASRIDRAIEHLTLLRAVLRAGS